MPTPTLSQKSQATPLAALAPPSETSAPTAGRRFPLFAAIVLVHFVFGCSIYANLSFAVTNAADYRYFPPFKPRENANQNRHLGGEYYNMGRALVADEGFAHPFDQPTGPTAWQPPLLPALLGALIWACDGDRDRVMTGVIFLQVFVLIGTGLLIVSLVRQTTTRFVAGVAVVVYGVALLSHFQLCFQWTHDCWIVLLALDLLLAGLCWMRPMQRWPTAAAWGLFGGLCLLLSPIVGFTWGLLSVLVGLRQRAWTRLGLTVLVAGLTLAPWTVRNYLVFGRVIPVKSNLAYEFYQSQCLQKDGLLQGATFALHPYHSGTRERQEYNSVGETVYLERKRTQFLQAVWADPLDFGKRVGQRFLGATLWYEPFWAGEAKRSWVVRFSRVTHPLPFLASLVLLFSAVWRRLAAAQWIAMGVYVVYLLPYVGISYYDRYALPLLGVKVLLVIWAGDRLLSFLVAAYRRGVAAHTV